MAYSSVQISDILLKADKTMYKLGDVAYENMFDELDEAYDYERDIIFIYKKAVEYGDNYFVGTLKLDQIVERLAAKLNIYDYGTLAPIYVDVYTQVDQGLNIIYVLKTTSLDLGPGLTGSTDFSQSQIDIDIDYAYLNNVYVIDERTLTINGVTYDLSANRTWTLNLDSVTDQGSVTTNSITVGSVYLTNMTAGSGALYYGVGANRLTLANYNAGGSVYIEVNGGQYSAVFGSDLSFTSYGTIAGVFNNATVDTDKFIVSDGGVLKYRTGTQLLSDIGGQPAGNYVLESRTLTINGTTYDLSANRSWAVGTVTSVNMTVPTGFTISGNPITSAGTLALAMASGYAIPTTASQANWDSAYNDKINSAAVTGTTTKTLTLTQQDGGTITASWTDDNTDAVSSVFGRTGAVTAQNGDYNTSQVTENTNLYFTDARARLAISETITGIDYDNTTGVFSQTTGYSIPTTASQTTWDTAYNDKINSASVSGTTTKTLTLNQQDGGIIQASWSDLDTGLTSVGLSMPSAFTVSNSPLTSNGTISVTGAGLVTQYVRGDGSLADFPTGGGGGGASVSYYLNGSVNQGTFGGNVYYEMNKTPILGTGTDFTISSNGYIAQFITDANDPALLKIPGGNWNFETFFSASSGGGSPTYYVELYKYDGTTFTLIASSSSNPDVITGGTAVEAYFSTLPVPETVLTATDRLAIRIYVTTAGRTITLHTEDNNLCQIITTFSTGLTALNGLTAQVQYFATGTSGSDFNINSSSATHTFNLPTASASNRGALSTADWTTFNNKQNAITLTTTGDSGASTFVSNTLNIPTYTIHGLGGVPETRTLTINGTAYDLSANRTWTIPTHDAVTVGQELSLALASGSANGALSSTDWTTFNSKQAALNGTGFVKISGTTISYDNSTYYLASNPSNYITLTSLSGTSPISYNNTTGAISISQASGTTNGFLSSTDWNTFNNKQSTITLTTTGSSGVATFTSNTLNVPNYTLSGLGGVPTSRTITINGTALDLSADRTFDVGTVTFVGPLTIGTSGNNINSSVATGNTTPVITLNIPTASATNRGALSSTDWTTFNNKQSALTNPVTGTGTTNYLPKFTGSTTIGDSVVQESSANIGIGGTPSRKLHSYGTIRSSNGANTIYSELQYDGVYATATDLYLLAPSTKAIVYYANNTEGMRLTSTGLGIGTTNPLVKLEIVGDYRQKALVGNSNGFNISINSSTDVVSLINYYNAGLAFGVNNAEGMRLTSTGLGIGTTSPSAKLDVVGAVRVSNSGVNTTFDSGAASDARLEFKRNGTRLSILNWDTGVTGFQMDSNNSFYITGGNVGIGLTTPGAKLEILGTSSDQLRLSTAATEHYRIGRNASTGYLDFYGSQTGYVGYLWSGVDGTRMTLSSSGQLGLGVTPSSWGSPFNVLEGGSRIADGGSSNTQSYIGFQQNVSSLKLGTNNYYLGNYLYRFTGAATRYDINDSNFVWNIAASGTAGATITFTQAMTLTAGGDLALGLTSPQQRLHVHNSGTSYVQISNDTTGTGGSDGADIGFFSGQSSLQINNRENADMVFSTNNTERFRIASTGAATFSSSVTAGARIQASGSNGAGFGQGGYLINYSADTASRTWLINNDNQLYGDFVIAQSTTQTGSTYVNRLYINPSGNVGIGDTNAAERLTVANTGTSDIISAYRPQNSNNNLAGYVFAQNNSSNAKVNIGGIYSLLESNTASSESGGLIFYTRSSGSYSERLRITSGGNVGIGSTSPVLKLDVVSTSQWDGIRVYNTSAAQGADIRELIFVLATIQIII